MATIRQKSRGQWQALVRRMGWPHQSGTFKTRKEAEMWARQTEAHMDRGVFVDQTAARQTTFRELIDLYIEQVTAYRPSEHSRVSETSKLRAFQRDEKDLCANRSVAFND